MMDNFITDCFKCNDGGGIGINVYVTEYYELPAKGEYASLSVGDFGGVGNNDGGWGRVTEYFNYQQRGSWPLSQLRSRR